LVWRDQSCEIDRRPRQPRQLAGANGNSAPCGTSFATGELIGERWLDGEADPITSAVAVDDAAAGRATADDVFKPNCLGIRASIDAHLLTPGAVPDST
jgi:hypothetical protein